MRSTGVSWLQLQENKAGANNSDQKKIAIAQRNVERLSIALFHDTCYVDLLFLYSFNYRDNHNETR